MEWISIGGYVVSGILVFMLGMFIGVARGQTIERSRPSAKVADVASGQLTQQIAAAEAEARRALEAKMEYGGLIERVIAQRERIWKMYQEHSGQHQTAQFILEREVATRTKMLNEAVRIVNVYRDKSGEPKLELPELMGPGDPPFGTAQKFKELIDGLTAEILKHPFVDGAKEKEEIDRRRAQA